MSTMVPLAADHPLMAAWNAIATTDLFRRTIAQAGEGEPNVRGALWGAFMWGWNVARGAEPFAPVDDDLVAGPPILFVGPEGAKYPISVGKLAELIGVARADLVAWIAYHATPLSVDEVQADMGVLAAVRVKGDADHVPAPPPRFDDRIVPNADQVDQIARLVLGDDVDPYADDAAAEWATS